MTENAENPSIEATGTAAGVCPWCAHSAELHSWFPHPRCQVGGCQCEGMSDD